MGFSLAFIGIILNEDLRLVSVAVRHLQGEQDANLTPTANDKLLVAMFFSL
jgi:hypothetical protein